MSKTKPWEISKLSIKQNLTPSAKIILRQRLESFLTSINLYLSEINPENLHQVRISLRRLRYPMEVFLKYFDRKKYWSFYKIVSSLQDLSGEVRDLDILKQNPEVSKRIIFEFVESENIENYEEVKLFIQNIRNFGCKIAIDDFGIGYSNFEHILELKPDFLKIDASLIKTIHTDKNLQIIVKTIRNFASELNILTVAEYVHSKEVFDMEKKLGIDYTQGYFIGEPAKELI